MDPLDAAAPWWRRRSAAVGFLCLGLVIWWWALRPAPVRWVPGQEVSQEPVQEVVEDKEVWHLEDGVVVEPLASYHIRARVLSRHDYHDEGAFVSPMDLALGWGDMSRQEVLDQLTISQSGRWYHYRWEHQPPLPVGQIVEQSANVHLIPASPSVKEVMEDVHEGDEVELEGYLVQVKRPDGWHWKSSLSRTDTGDGACELLWVEHAKMRNKSL